MKKKYNWIKITTVLLLLLKMSIVNAQKDTITLKTSEIYRVEFPNKGEYQSGNFFVTWKILPNYQAIEIDHQDEDMKDMTIFYKSSEVLEKSENSIKINYEGETELISLIMKNNFIKIKVYFNEIKNSEHREFKDVHVFTNYSIENILDILRD